MQRRKRRVWSAVRKDAEAVRTGARRGALVARRGVKKGASDSYLDALARVRIEDPARAALIGCRHTAHDNGPGGTPERLASWQCTTARRPTAFFVAQSMARGASVGGTWPGGPQSAGLGVQCWLYAKIAKLD